MKKLSNEKIKEKDKIVKCKHCLSKDMTFVMNLKLKKKIPIEELWICNDCGKVTIQRYEVK